MGRYKLVFKKSVVKDLRTLPKKDVARILSCFDVIAADPRGPGCERLSGQDRYRVRQGAYRIIYEIHDELLLITVVRVGHRREVYRGT